MLLVAFFYFQNEQRLYFDLTKSKMQNITSKISAKIVFAHMTNSFLDKNSLLKSKEYKLALYNGKKEKIFGDLEDKINFSKTFLKYEKHYVLIDNSALGHLGVFYIVIKEKTFFKIMQDLQVNILIFFISIYLLISILGYYLAKLFLKPIKEERIKLNNFIKDTTHELNTPISAILMSTESDSLSTKQIQRVRISAKRVSEIYKDLSYIFLQEHENKKVLQNLRLDEIIKEQLLHFEPLCIKKHINISIDVDEYNFKMDKDDFIRAFNNLLSNAIKYNKVSGNITILLKNNILSIKDTGIGIEKDKLKEIFTRYYRATSQQGGFGIGLSIVKHICLHYNIKIEVQSKLNEGSTFTLDFK